MNLRNKLFFSIGTYFFCVTLLFVIFFFFLLKRDFTSINEKLGSLFTLQKYHEQQAELSFFKEKIDEEKKKLDALFLVLEPQKNKWSFLASILATHPDLGFSQYHIIDSDEVFTLIPSLASFHAISTIAMNDQFLFVVLDKDDQKNDEENLFLAYPVTSTVYGGFPTYLLFSWQEIGKEIDVFINTLKNRPPISLPQPRSIAENTQEKLGLINTLALFFEKGIAIFPDKKLLIPKGIAILSSDGKGKALLTKELFQKKSYFDDQGFYEKNRSSSSFSPVAEGEFLIKDIPGEIFIVNSALNDNALLTLGFSLNPLTRNFAKLSHQNVIFSSDEKKWGFSALGDPLSQDDLNKTSLHKLSHLSLLPTNDLTLFLIPNKEEKFLPQAIGVLNQNLLYRLFWQMAIILFCLLIISLIICYYYTRRVTEPLSHLVKSLSEIKRKNYKLVKLSEKDQRGDELCALTAAFNEMITELQDKDRIRALLNKVVSKEIAEEILKSDIHLGGEDRVITILFADIRNFTALSQKLPPQKTVAILNAVMTLVSRVIESEGGVIDKYVGDEVMALFGAPIAYPDHGIRALAAAKLIIETLRKWNKERVAAGEASVEIGIGISTGLVVAGNMGAEDRLNYTVVGPSVNLAARLCTAALPMQIIISEFTLEEPSVRDSFYVESLEPISLKGFLEPVKIFQVTGFKWEV